MLLNKFSWEEVREYLIKILYIILPIGIIYSTKIYMRFAVPLLILIVVIQIYKQGFKVSFYEKGACLFFLTVIISIVFSNYDRKESLKFFTGNLIYWIFIPTLLGQIKLKRENFKIFLLSTYLGSCLIFKKYINELIYMVKIVSKVDVTFWDLFKFKNLSIIVALGKKGYRLTLVFKEGHFYALAVNAAFLSILIVVGVIYIYATKDKMYLKIIAGFFTGVSAIFLILTQSRAGYLSVILVFLGMTLYYYRRKAIYIVIPIVGVLVYAMYRFKNNPYVNRLGKIGDIGKDVSLIGRFEVYKESFRIFKENIFTGVGIENFKYAQNMKAYKIGIGGYLHSHNMGLKLLSEVGIFGFLSYYYLMFSILKKLIRKIVTFEGSLAFFVIVCILIFENFEILTLKKYLHTYIFFIIGIGINSYYVKWRE